jgi:peptidoglycan/LPS O-acetylase OafA/YrhL
MPLTGLRAFAALWVVAYHYRHVFAVTLPGFPPLLGERGYLGVDIFFVLSGFILSYNYGGRLSSGAAYRSFLVNRIARLYPLHLATLVACMALVAVASAVGFTVNHPQYYVYDYHLLLQLLLLHAWGFEHTLSWNIPSWSISAEFFAYLLFPIFYWTASRLKRPLPLMLGAVISIGGMIAVLRNLGHASLHVSMEHTLIRVSSEFLAGCLVYRLYEIRRSLPTGSTLLYLVLLFAVFVVAVSAWSDPLMPYAACLLVYVLARGSGPALRAFTLAPVVWLGRVSYSIYLTHLMLISMLLRLTPLETLQAMGPLARLAVLGLHGAVLIAVAASSYHLVEVPGRRIVRDWFTQGQEKHTAAK